MWKILRELNRAEILSIKGLYYLFGSLLREGINLMAILRFSSKRFPNKIALKDDHSAISYEELYTECKRLAAYYKQHGIRSGQKIGILFQNNADLVKNLYAFSKLGTRLLLINTELSPNQFTMLCKQEHFDRIIASTRLKDRFPHQPELLFFEDLRIEFRDFNPKNKLRRSNSGSIGVMSGGSSGEYKTASRKPSVLKFLNPFLALLTVVKIHERSTVLITTPLFHGFGLSAAIVGLLLGKKVVIQAEFKSKSTVELIQKEKIDVLILVPTILQRLLDEENPALNGVRTILTGGAKLNAELSKRTLSDLGNVLYNLYGSSEGGFSLIASPSDLSKYPETVGRPIKGTKVQVDTNKCLQLRSSWMMSGIKSNWWNTKDLCIKNEAGFYFINGRFDDMIVSGGENVHPQEVQDLLISHDKIKDAFVLGVPDEIFGERLIAFVVLENENLPESDLNDWLKLRLARFQIPREIIFAAKIPILSTGKVDRTGLLSKITESDSNKN